MGSKNMSVGRLSVEMVADTVQYVNKLKEAEDQTKSKLNSMVRSYDKAGKASSKAGKQLGGFSNALRNAAQSAQLVDGPLGGVASRLTTLASVISGGGVSIGLVAIGTALTGLGIALKSGLRVLDETNVSLNVMSKQLQLTENSVGFTVDALDKFARKLALDTLTSTKDVRAAMQLLLTTTNLTGESFLQVTKLAQDMAQAGIGSITSNAKKLAVILQDPVEGMTRLERMLVKLTPKQEASIRAFVEQGEALKAQQVIIDAVAKSYGGLATAVNSSSTVTIASQVDELSQRWDEFTEALANGAAYETAINYLGKVNSMLVNLTNVLDGRIGFEIDTTNVNRDFIQETFGDADKVYEDQGKSLNQFIQDTAGGVQKATEELEKFTAAQTNLADKWASMNGRERAKFINDKNTQEDEIEREIGKWERILFIQKDRLEQAQALNDSYLSYKKKREDEDLRLSLENQHKQQLAYDSMIMGILKRSEEASKEAAKQAAKDLKAREKELKSLFSMMESTGFVRSKNNFSITDLAGMSKDDFDELNNAFSEFMGIRAEQLDAAEKQEREWLAGKETMTDLARLFVGDTFVQDLKAQYDQDLENYELYLQGKANKEALYQELVRERTNEYAQTLYNQSLQASKRDTELVSSALTNVNDALASVGEEGSDIAKAAFVMQQAIAAANVLVATEQAVWAAKATLPDLGAQAAAETAIRAQSIMSLGAIAAATIGGVAHGGMDSVPSESTFLLQKGERVIQPKANEDLTSFLKDPSTQGGEIKIDAPINVSGNVTDESWFQAQLYKQRQIIRNSVDKASRERPRR